MVGADFLEAFSTCTARRDYAAALACLERRLQDAPDDSFALELKQSIEELHATVVDRLVADSPTGRMQGQLPATLEALRGDASEACARACRALLECLRAEERCLWALGQQSVGIFCGPGQAAPAGERQDQLLQAAEELAEAVERRLLAARGQPEAELPDYGYGSWLLEAAGLLWWQAELASGPKPALLAAAREEWAADGSMEALVGYSAADLTSVPQDELCDVLEMACMLERCHVCGLFGEGPPPSPAYGVAELLAEVWRRPLVEPPLPGFSHSFYLAVQVVYVLNSWNGYLPNRRDDCPWLYNYLERCLFFWLHEAKDETPPLSLLAPRRSEPPPPASAAAAPGPRPPPPPPGAPRAPVLPPTPSAGRRRYGAESVEAVAAAVDVLRGLGSEGETEVVREAAAWLLSRQEDDGFFYSPGAKRPPDNEYDRLQPTWRALAALQLDREEGACRPEPRRRCAAWAEHARAAARRAGFHEPPRPTL